MPLATRLRRAAARLGEGARSPAARLRLVYFLYFAASGTSLPYLAVYLRGRGFSGQQIGSIQMLPSLLAPLVAMSWAAAADRRGDPGRVLGWITAWAACAAVFLPFAATPFLVGLVVFGQSLGDRAVVPLLDAVSLEHCRAHPGTSYSRFRSFGSLGFVVLTWALGQVLTARGDRPGDPLIPATISFFVVCYALAARGLARAPAAHPGRPSPRDMLGLLGHGRLMLLFAVCAVHWAACVPYTMLLGVFVRDLGLPARVTGLGIPAAVSAEIAVMMLYPLVERRFPARGLLVFAFLASAVRWALLSRATGAPAVVALQLLHGLTYGLYWSTLMRAVGALVPPRLRATGLALCAALVSGVGNAVGAALAGIGYDRYGSMGPVFGWAAVAELVIALAVLALLAGRAVREAVGPVDRPA